MKAKLTGFWVAMIAAGTLSAQTTVTFEGSANGATSFTSGASTFNLTSSATSFYVRVQNGLGYSSSNTFIHADDSYGQTGSIIKTSGTFNINSFWFFVTGNASQTPGATSGGAGSVTFRGKLGGATQFTVIKTSGFATNFNSPGNGFALINFATDNNATKQIDRLEIELSANFDYFAIDNFIFSLPVLPVVLTQFTARLENERQVALQWQTSSEQQNQKFIIYRSGEDRQFIKLTTVAGNGTSPTGRHYSAVDRSPLSGNNYYKLAQVDRDGKEVDLEESVVNFSFFGTQASAHPNPVKDKVTIRFSKGKYHQLTLTSLDGRRILQQQLTANQESMEVDLGRFSKGTYLVQLSGVEEQEVIKLLRQ